MSYIQLASSFLEQGTLGIGLASPLVTDPGNGDFLRTAEEANVLACIQDLLETRVGSRVMNEDVGTEIPGLLFENIDSVIEILPVTCTQAIVRYEPRVTKVKAKPRKTGVTEVTLDLSWVIKSTGKPSGMTFPFYLETTNGGV